MKSVVRRGLSAPSALWASSTRSLAAAIRLDGQASEAAFQRRWLGESAGAGGDGNGGNGPPFIRQQGYYPPRQQTYGGQFGYSPPQSGYGQFPPGSGFQQPQPANVAPLRRPTPDPKETIYVGNLYFSVTPADLKTEFSQFGNVLDARVICDNQGTSRGFGYVKFDNLENARKAIGSMHLQLYEGRRIAVNFAQSNFTPNDPGEVNPTRTLYLGNIPFEMTDRELNDIFKDMDNLIDVRVAVDRRTGQPRGFCHAEFVNVKSSQVARKLLRRLRPYGRQLRMDYSNSSPGRLQQYLAQKGIDPATIDNEPFEGETPDTVPSLFIQQTLEGQGTSES